MTVKLMIVSFIQSSGGYSGLLRLVERYSLKSLLYSMSMSTIETTPVCSHCLLFSIGYRVASM